MTELIDEQLIQARFEALANLTDDSDWSEILQRLDGDLAEASAAAGAPRILFPIIPRRSRAGRLRYAAATTVLLVAAVTTAVAFGWPQGFINFLSAPSAPKKVKNSFGAQNVIAPPGMNPLAIPGKARRIMSARFDATGIHPGHGGWHVLYVAPTRKGGFCYEWTRFTGTCFDPTAKVSNRLSRTAGPLGVTWMGNTFPKVIAGYVRSGTAKTVEARFANGGSAEIPVTWVSTPIDAGFFIYVIPTAHQSLTAAVTSVVSLDGNGKVVGTQTFPTTSPLDQEVPRRLPDGTRVSLSARAEVSTARKLISFRATNGSAVWLWAMMRRGGGICFVFNQGSGCPPRAALVHGPAFAGGLSIGTRRVLFFAEAKPTVTGIELRYQNGSRELVRPIDGFVLPEVTPVHYAPGTRLVSAIGLDSAGRILFRQNFQPQSHGVYPCKKPVARGYGVKSCP